VRGTRLLSKHTVEWTKIRRVPERGTISVVFMASRINILFIFQITEIVILDIQKRISDIWKIILDIRRPNSEECFQIFKNEFQISENNILDIRNKPFSGYQKYLFPISVMTISDI